MCHYLVFYMDYVPLSGEVLSLASSTKAGAHGA